MALIKVSLRTVRPLFLRLVVIKYLVCSSYRHAGREKGTGDLRINVPTDFAMFSHWLFVSIGHVGAFEPPRRSLHSAIGAVQDYLVLVYDIV